MNYSEIIGAIEAHAGAYEGFDFITVGEQQVNTYATKTDTPSQALIVLEPPQYTGGLSTMTLSKKYSIVMAFMMHIEQDTSYIERQAKVNIADQYATHFLHSLNQNKQAVANFNNAEIDGVRVIPFHRFSWNAQHMAGVTLEFRIQTLDTFDYCDLSVEDFEAGTGIGEWIIESTFTVQ